MAKEAASGGLHACRLCRRGDDFFSRRTDNCPMRRSCLWETKIRALAAVAVENGTLGRAGISVYSLDAPETETVSLVLTLETDSETEISVSHGIVSDMLTGEPEQTLTFSEDAKLFWDIEDISPDETAYLTVKNAKTGEICSEYAVAKDKETDTWFIRLNQTEDTTEKE